MSASNNRITESNSYHHLMSRIAHQVFFLTEDVRNDLMEMILRSAEFHGIKLISWCIMTNHFHLLAYLPDPELLGEDEIVRRYGVLYGTSRRDALMARLAMLRASHPQDDALAQAELKRLTDRMYKIGEFMKVIKQWLTQEYNRRYSHSGTMWDSVYKDIPVKGESTALAKRAGYIHLNPVRAAITSEFDGYLWSSLTALKRGDEIALSGLRVIYGDDATKDEILGAHKHLMAELLEKYKLERAKEIAQKRRAGFHVEADPLTTEAMFAQATAQIEACMIAGVEDSVVTSAKRGRPVNANIESHIKRLLDSGADLSARALAEAVGCSVPTVYRYLRKMRKP